MLFDLGNFVIRLTRAYRLSCGCRQTSLSGFCPLRSFSDDPMLCNGGSVIVWLAGAIGLSCSWRQTSLTRFRRVL